MKCVIFIGAILAVGATSAQANPWQQTPPTPSYKGVADAVKASTPPGQPSALNPSCAGMTGDECTKSAKAYDKPLPKKEEASNEPPPRPKQ